MIKRVLICILTAVLLVFLMLAMSGCALMVSLFSDGISGCAGDNFEDGEDGFTCEYCGAPYLNSIQIRDEHGVGKCVNAAPNGSLGEGVGAVDVIDTTIIDTRWTVTFDMNGEKAEQSVLSGEMPTPPSNEEAQKYAPEGQTFTGWDKPIVEATGDVTYTAQYEPEQFDITFAMDVESVTTAYAGGETPVPPSDEEAQKYAPEGQVFSKWEPAIVPVEEAATYTAVYVTPVKTYKITFVMNGYSVTRYTEKGKLPDAPHTEAANRAPKDTVFHGWSPSVVEASKHQTYEAIYHSAEAALSSDASLDSIQVLFKNGDGNDDTRKAQNISGTYYAEVDGGATDIVVSASPAHPSASVVAGNGSASIGSVTIIIEAEDGTRASYTLVIMN